MNSPLLSLDIGLKRTGVALSESGMLARPLTTIEAKPPHMVNVVTEVLDLIKEHEIQTLIVGVPYTEDERTTSQALKTEQIITQIEVALKGANLDPRVVRVNEYHSSEDAHQQFPDLPLDEAAASLILQDYIDNNA